MKSLIRLFTLSICLVSLSYDGFSQSDEDSNLGSSLGIELQVYPTGVIPGLRYELPLSDRGNLYLRAGYQIIDHRDLGVQDDESGTGYGFSVGYHHYFKADRTKWSILLKNDVWFNTIDWASGTDLIEVFGTSDITVIQPTAQVEYSIMLSDKMRLSPSFAFGFEWNVKTEGRETGQGAIILLGLSLDMML